MAKTAVILLCSVTTGGPTFDKKGVVDGTTEKVLEAGSKVEFDEKEAARLVSLGAAKLPAVEVEPAPAEEPPPPPPPTDPVDPAA